MTKILFLSSWYPSDKDASLGIFVKKHAESAVLQGNEVLVLYATRSDFTKSITHKSENLKEEISYFKSSKWFAAIKYILAYRQLLLKNKDFIEKASIVHFHVAFPIGILLYFFPSLKKKHIIYSEHWTGFMKLDGRYKGFFRKLITKNLVSNSKIILPVSQVLKNAMLQHQLMANYTVVGNVIEEPVLELLAKPELSVSDEFCFLNISDLNDAHKNISGLLKAFEVHLEEYPKSKLKILGAGTDEIILKKMASNSSKLSSSVEFLGFKNHNEVYLEISKAHCLVVNSNFESFSMVSLEAMACGVPVIATKCGGPEAFVNREVGILIEPNNSSELILALANMIENHSKFNPNYLKEYAIKMFGKNAIGLQLNSVYEEVIQND